MQKTTKKIAAFAMALCLCMGLVPFSVFPGAVQEVSAQLQSEDIPSYTGSPYTQINDNVPDFPLDDYMTEAFETYSDLDELGRCGVAYANVCQELMPTQKRGKIGQVKPSGWQTAKYDSVDGKYLYNRCHLIGYQLTGENANEKNLITGTRYLNVDGMLPFENMVADYVKETGNHVLYRVTPIFTGDNLVADGVQMEAESVEDNGDGILFNVFCYNVQPGTELIMRQETTGKTTAFRRQKNRMNPRHSLPTMRRKQTHRANLWEQPISSIPIQGNSIIRSAAVWDR